MKKNIKFTKIMVEIDGKIININDLPKDEYEYFLELMEKLKFSYLSIKMQINNLV